MSSAATRGLAAATVTDALLIAPGERYTTLLSSTSARFPGHARDHDEQRRRCALLAASRSARTASTQTSTDRIMAFDVTERLNRRIPDRFDPGKIACFEGNAIRSPMCARWRSSKAPTSMGGCSPCWVLLAR